MERHSRFGGTYDFDKASAFTLVGGSKQWGECYTGLENNAQMMLAGASPRPWMSDFLGISKDSSLSWKEMNQGGKLDVNEVCS